MKNDITKMWESRRLAVKDEKFKGVLFRSWSQPMNDYLHVWSYKLIVDHTPPGIQNAVDIGCGYGRISLEIARRFRGIRLTGFDIAPQYVAEYKKIPNSQAFVSDCTSLPLSDESQDMAFEAFSLLYLPNKELFRKAVAEMFRIVRKGGHVIIIENTRIGAMLASAFGVLPFLARLLGITKFKPSPRTLKFSANEIQTIGEQFGGHLLKKVGFPLFTLFIPFGNILGRIWPNLTRRILRWIEKVDSHLQRFNAISLYQFHLFIKR